MPVREGASPLELGPGTGSTTFAAHLDSHTARQRWAANGCHKKGNEITMRLARPMHSSREIGGWTDCRRTSRGGQGLSDVTKIPLCAK